MYFISIKFIYVCYHDGSKCLDYHKQASEIFIFMIVDPIFTIEATTISTPEIYQPLILQCTATIVRGITSTVDIIWTTGNTQVRRVNDVTASSNINSSSIYNDSFIIPSLNLSDIGSVYECEVLINSLVPTTAITDFIVPVPGTYVPIHMYSVHTYTYRDLFPYKCSYMCLMMLRKNMTVYTCICASMFCFT